MRDDRESLGHGYRISTFKNGTRRNRHTLNSIFIYFFGKMILNKQFCFGNVENGNLMLRFSRCVCSISIDLRLIIVVCFCYTSTSIPLAAFSCIIRSTESLHLRGYSSGSLSNTLLLVFPLSTLYNHLVTSASCAERDLMILPPDQRRYLFSFLPSISLILK